MSVAGNVRLKHRFLSCPFSVCLSEFAGDPPFLNYSEFCFRILAEVDRQVDSTQLRPAAKRFLGYLGESCLTLCLFHIQERDKAKILELNGSYLLSDEVIKPTLGRLLFYRLMSKITFGKRRRTYKARKKQIAQLRRLEKLSTLPQKRIRERAYLFTNHDFEISCSENKCDELAGEVSLLRHFIQMRLPWIVLRRACVPAWFVVG